eukprot:1154872-Pelagomonas_calceolata.AAC.4
MAHGCSALKTIHFVPDPRKANAHIMPEERACTHAWHVGSVPAARPHKIAKLAQPIEYLRRPERLGLGAAAVPVKDAGKKVVKMGE